MKLLHVIDELRIGGAQTHLLTMVRHAVRAYSVEHRVVSLFGDGLLRGDFEAIGIPVDVLDLRPELARRAWRRAVKRIESVLWEWKPDVVEAHLSWSRLLGLWAAWRAGVALRIGFEQGDIYLKSWKFRIANYLGQYCARRMVVCSHALAEWVHRTHRIHRDRLLVLHNCVDLEEFRPRGRREGIVFGFSPGTTVFAAVGSLGRGVNKRVDVCIRALARARGRGAEVALVICGDGDQRPELEALARSVGVAGSVRFLGNVRHVPAVLGSCDAFCHAAPFEPFGIVCIEAMATGLPVVVPDSGGIREAVHDGVNGVLYPALDDGALAAAMSRLHLAAATREAMGIAGRRAVENHFSVQSYVRRLYEVYGFRVDATVSPCTV